MQVWARRRGWVARHRSHRSSGVNPVRLAIRASIRRTDLSSPSWNAKTKSDHPGRARVLSEPDWRLSNAKTGKMEQRTVPGAHFLWLVLQHVLPKGFRRARNFGFLHPNCKRLISLLHLLLSQGIPSLRDIKFHPGQTMVWFKKRAPILCTCCGAVMVIVRTRIRSVFSGLMPVPIVTQAVH